MLTAFSVLFFPFLLLFLREKGDSGIKKERKKEVAEYREKKVRYFFYFLVKASYQNCGGDI